MLGQQTATKSQSRAEYMRGYRQRRKANGGQRLTAKVAGTQLALPQNPPAQLPADPAAALARWAKERLVIPPGHALEGEPMAIPEFGIAFIRDALKHRESLLCIGRKNAKSAIVAAYLLCRLVGPLAFRGYRAGVCSVNREKAGELWLQAQQIAEASNLQGLTFRKVPKQIEGPWGGLVDVLSADASAGHASGFDDSICDELGLFKERDRPTVNGMRSAISARNGRFMALSILGDAPFTKEIIARKKNKGTAVHLYASKPDCAIDDPKAWADSNPGIAAGIKASEYMADEAERVRTSPADEAAFRAFDLNQPGEPGKQMIVTLTDWKVCSVHSKPERAGPCFVGFDPGGSCSMTATAIYWPDTCRLECYGAYGSTPDLSKRGEADGVGRAYLTMAEGGELQTFPGRVTPVAEFLTWIGELLQDQHVQLFLADRYRQGECADAVENATLNWPTEWRAQGSGPSGSADVRDFQKAVISGDLRPGESLLLEYAIAESVLRFDGNGNPSLDKSRSRGRIDALSAAILAVGAGSRFTGPGTATVYHIGHDEL